MYQIDQSGKIENTNRQTIVALANGKQKTIKISAKEKQKLLSGLKELEWPKTNYIYKVFAVLIFLLIKDTGINRLEIDREYFGHESVIKDVLHSICNRQGVKTPDIHFVLVGKQSSAHKIALATFQLRCRPSITVKAGDVFQIFYTNKKGWRLRSGRNNP